MRKLLIGPKEVINETALAVQEVGLITDVDQIDLLTYDVIWNNGAGPLDAEVIVEYSHDKKTWYTLEFNSTVDLTGASGSHRIDIEPNFKYLRPTVNFVAGNCDIVLIAKGTTKGA
jgi:hypothetical protein